MDISLILSALQQLALITVLVEALTESAKLAIPTPLGEQQKQAISYGIGIVLCICVGTSLFEGSLVVRLIGAVLAGVLAGRGSNYIHTLVGLLVSAGSALKEKALSLQAKQSK
jgi:formate/nitrite transporter FocA (FNT family)